MILEISTDNLIDDRQLGWIDYQEGDSRIRVKVVRGTTNIPFISHSNYFRDSERIRAISYEDRLLWNQKQKAMLDVFKKTVGNDYWFNFRKIGK